MIKKSFIVLFIIVSFIVLSSCSSDKKEAFKEKLTITKTDLDFSWMTDEDIRNITGITSLGNNTYATIYSDNSSKYRNKHIVMTNNGKIVWHEDNDPIDFVPTNQGIIVSSYGAENTMKVFSLDRNGKQLWVKDVYGELNYNQDGTIFMETIESYEHKVVLFDEAGNIQFSVSLHNNESLTDFQKLNHSRYMISFHDNLENTDHMYIVDDEGKIIQDISLTEIQDKIIDFNGHILIDYIDENNHYYLKEYSYDGELLYQSGPYDKIELYPNNTDNKNVYVKIRDDFHYSIKKINQKLDVAWSIGPWNIIENFDVFGNYFVFTTEENGSNTIYKYDTDKNKIIDYQSNNKLRPVYFDKDKTIFAEYDIENNYKTGYLTNLDDKQNETFRLGPYSDSTSFEAFPGGILIKKEDHTFENVEYTGQIRNETDPYPFTKFTYVLKDGRTIIYYRKPYDNEYLTILDKDGSIDYNKRTIAEEETVDKNQNHMMTFYTIDNANEVEKVIIQIPGFNGYN